MEIRREERPCYVCTIWSSVPKQDILNQPITYREWTEQSLLHAVSFSSASSQSILHHLNHRNKPTISIEDKTLELSLLVRDLMILITFIDRLLVLILSLNFSMSWLGLSRHLSWFLLSPCQLSSGMTFMPAAHRLCGVVRHVTAALLAFYLSADQLGK